MRASVDRQAGIGDDPSLDQASEALGSQPVPAADPAVLIGDGVGKLVSEHRSAERRSPRIDLDEILTRQVPTDRDVGALRPIQRPMRTRRSRSDTPGSFGCSTTTGPVGEGHTTGHGPVDHLEAALDDPGVTVERTSRHLLHLASGGLIVRRPHRGQRR